MPDREIQPGTFVWVKGPWEDGRVCGRVLARRGAEFHVAWADAAGGLMEKAFSSDEMTLAAFPSPFVFASDPEPKPEPIAMHMFKLAEASVQPVPPEERRGRGRPRKGEA